MKQAAAELEEALLLVYVVPPRRGRPACVGAGALEDVGRFVPTIERLQRKLLWSPEASLKHARLLARSMGFLAQVRTLRGRMGACSARHLELARDFARVLERLTALEKSFGAQLARHPVVGGRWPPLAMLREDMATVRHLLRRLERLADAIRPHELNTLFHRVCELRIRAEGLLTAAHRHLAVLHGQRGGLASPLWN